MMAEKGGQVVAQGLIVVSADEESQDVTLTRPDAVMSVYHEKAKAKSTEKGFGNKAVRTRNNPLGPRRDIEGMFAFFNAMKLSLDYVASSV
jgi:hypothetical protein